MPRELLGCCVVDIFCLPVVREMLYTGVLNAFQARRGGESCDSGEKKPPDQNFRFDPEERHG